MFYVALYEDENGYLHSLLFYYEDYDSALILSTKLFDDNFYSLDEFSPTELESAKLFASDYIQ
ncbi:MAG: hypothetical protein ACI4L9_05155 [Candidatus Coproplasma sp.]